MGNLQEFKTQLNELTKDYQSDVAETKAEYAKDVQEVKDKYDPTPELKNAIDEVTKLSHTAFQDVWKRSDQYLHDVETLYKDTYGQEGGTKPVEPEEPGGETKPVTPEEPGAGQLPSQGERAQPKTKQRKY